VPFDYADVVVTDDQGLVPMLNFGTDAGGDRRLSPGETWTYQATGVAENLAVTTAVNLDFETNGSGVALNAGDIIDDEFQDAYGLTISAPGHPHGTMIFDSANPTGDPDDDLGTPNEAYGGTGVSEDGSGAGVTNTQPLGNVLILSQDGDASDPNDDKYGGTFRFEWDEAVQLNSMDLLDIEKPGSQVTTYDAEGNVVGNYLLQALGDNSFQTLDFQNEWITRMDVTFASADGIASGAIASVDFSRTFYRNLGTVTVNGWEGVTDSDWSHYQNEAPLPTRQPIAVIGSSLQMPAPASIAPSMADLATSLMLRPADLTLRGTEAGDRLTGESGDDTLRGLAGNDRLLGRQGQDTLLGGAGNDLLNGGHGNDRIGAGAGDDVVVVRQGRDRIATGNGDDVIAIGGDGFAIVTDFQMGQDSLRLLGSASQTEFADLTLLERNNGLLVRNDSSNIAYLAGLDTSEASAVLLG
jgi:Ca2+-binding RTX toxin-like protein